MAISEAQLETWSHLGPTSQFTDTYKSVKSVLESADAPYANRSFEIFLQGSYGNDTNIYADSDVDIVIRTDDVYYYDTTQITQDEKTEFQKTTSRASYQLEDFKRDVVAWLTARYPSSVTVGTKAVTVKGNGSRRDVDVLVCAQFRKYRSYTGEFNQSYEAGICFFLPNGTRIENFPKQHSANCTTKHQATSSWFKRSVRTYKNLRNKLIASGALADGVAPSYFIEGLLYNVPVDRFGGTHSQNFLDVLNWVYAADRSKFLCANEEFYLLNDYSPVTWTAAKCDKFLRVVIDEWNK